VDVVSKYENPGNDTSDVRCASGVTSMHTCPGIAGESSGAASNCEASVTTQEFRCVNFAKKLKTF
jgi:hypothetical protein